MLSTQDAKLRALPWYCNGHLARRLRKHGLVPARLKLKCRGKGVDTGPLKGYRGLDSQCEDSMGERQISLCLLGLSEDGEETGVEEGGLSWKHLGVACGCLTKVLPA